MVAKYDDEIMKEHREQREALRKLARNLSTQSCSMRSRSEVAPRQPFTCAQPVTPAFTLWRSM